MNETIKSKLKSNRFQKEFPVELYKKDKELVIKHTSLEQMFWSLPDEDRPKLEIQPFNLAIMPGIPPMFAVKCILSDGKAYVEQIGEMLAQKWAMSPPITHEFPLTTCKNQAFDRAFIRFMQFDTSPFDTYAIYSSEEIPLGEGAVPVMSKGIGMEPDGVIPEEMQPNMMDPMYDIPVGTTLMEQGDEINSMADMMEPMPEMPYAYAGAMPPMPETMDPMPNMPDAGNTQAGTGYGIAPDAPEPPYMDDQAYIGMGMPEIPDAPGYGGTQGFEEIFGDAGMPDFGDTAGSPFPWAMPAANEAPGAYGAGTAMEPPMPDTLDFPETGNENANGMAAPTKGADAGKKTVSVYGVIFNSAIGKTEVETDAGTLFYDPHYRQWSSDAVDVNSLYTDDIYRQASSQVHCELNDFCGDLLP